MESIIALEELIKENESIVTLQKRQLADHESGVSKLSRMSEASTENTLEIASELLAKYKSMLDNLLAQDQTELEEKERLLAIAERKKYFDAQDSRIKLHPEHSSDKKLEVMRIIGELPDEVQFEDEELFEIATKSIELSLPELNELSQKLDNIKIEFKSLIKKSELKDMQEMGTIDFLIPVIILHFSLLLSNIKQTIEDKNKKALEKQTQILQERAAKQEKLLEEIMQKEQLEKEQAEKENSEAKNEANEEDKESDSIDTKDTAIEETVTEEKPTEELSAVKENTLAKEIDDTKEIKIKEEPLPEIKELKFSGFPRYQDWWIRELWLSHQAYFALYKWKDIINNLCMTTEQKKAWSIIFDRWVFIKKILNDKGELAYNYTFAFDSLLLTHAQIDEELENKNIMSMELIINEITKKEDFTTTVPFHNTTTPYLLFKKEKLHPTKKNKENK